MTFSEVFAVKRQKGRASLRHAQFQLAQKNARMAIWLGKQYLDQTEQGRSEGISPDMAEDNSILEQMFKRGDRDAE